MRALQWFGRDDIRLGEIDDPPPPGAGEILVDVEWCGICGTDLEEFTDGPIIIPTSPHPLTGLMAPITLGHEVVGRVAVAGSGVDVKVDTRVALDGFLPCGRCGACRRNHITRCELWGHIGLSSPGGLAEKLLVPAQMALAAPDGVPSDHLALTEPFAVAVRAVRRARLALGDRVGILGGGTIGLAVLQVARTSGCGEAFLVDPIVARRELGVRFGATGVAADADDLLSADLRNACDVVFDCTGISDTPGQGVELVRPGGRVVLVGVPPEPGKIDYKTLVIKEVSLIGTVGHVYDEDTRTAVSLISSGRVDPAPMVTHRLPLERAVEDGFRFLTGSGRSSAIKVLVSPELAP